MTNAAMLGIMDELQNAKDGLMAIYFITNTDGPAAMDESMARSIQYITDKIEMQLTSIENELRADIKGGAA